MLSLTTLTIGNFWREMIVDLLRYDEVTHVWIYLEAADIEALECYDHVPCGPKGEAPFHVSDGGFVHVLNSESTYDCWRGRGHAPLGPPART